MPQVKVILPPPPEITINIEGLTAQEYRTVLRCLKRGSAGVDPETYISGGYVAGKLYNKLAAQRSE
jgi:hypothetical protein